MFNNTIIIDTRKVLSTKYKKAVETLDTFVNCVDNLKDAYKYIQENEPDLIIVSDSISEALEVFCNKIRVLTYNMRPIIIALSKSADINDRIKVLESGADDFISEPVDIKEFKIRIKAHLRREAESNLDKKTMLPNKQYSIRALKRVVADKKNWATLLVGIENLIPYKEVYTELAADKVIQTFIAIINSALTEKDYLGQISENEFIIITQQNIAERIASLLSFAFDTVAPKFYSNDDAKRGYMLLEGDDLAGIRIPFLALSIGVISSEVNKYDDIEKLYNKLVQLKSLAKLPSKSNFIVERVKISGEKLINNDKFNNKIAIIEEDAALELLLKTTLELQGYNVISNINDIENFMPIIIIIDSGEELKNLELCEQYKNSGLSSSKIIVTSVYHDKTKILNSGADLYIPKPYEITTIIKWVEYFINQIRY